MNILDTATLLAAAEAAQDWLLNVWLVEGASGFNGWQILLYGFVMTQITIATVTLYLHRHAAHRAIDLHPVLVHFFRFWVYLTTGMIPREWVAVHRKHHANCETEDDPHSPQVRGIRKVLLEGAELYRESINSEMLNRYGTGMPDDWLERHIYGHPVLNTSGIVFLMVVNLLMFGPVGLTVWAVQMLWIPVWAAGVINGVGHYLGYRNHECPDAATNILPWGLFIGGEELHNNHHTYPNSARFSVKWWELDIGWFYICLLKMFGLVIIHSTGPIVRRNSDSREVGIDTVRGVINDRFHVLAQFKEKVLKSVAAEEYAQSSHPVERAALKSAPKLLARDESLRTGRDREQMETLFSFSGNLQALYKLQKDLKLLWERRDYSKEEVLAAFKCWIEEAEQMDIDSLTAFSKDLRAYSLPKAGS